MTCVSKCAPRRHVKMVSFFFFFFGHHYFGGIFFCLQRILGKMQLDITDAAVLFRKGEGQPHSNAEKIGEKGPNQTS